MLKQSTISNEPSKELPKLQLPANASLALRGSPVVASKEK
jgi:hypothetical protein